MGQIPTAPKLRQRTVYGAAATILLRALEEIGGDVSRAVAASDLGAYKNQILAGTVTDIPRLAFARLSREIVLALHAHSCRRDLVRPLPVDQMQMMCLIMTACPTLGVALQKAMEFIEYVQSGQPRFRLSVAGPSALLILDTGERGRNLGDMIVILYGLAALHRLLGWLASASLPLQEAGLRFPEQYAEPTLYRLLHMRPKMGMAENYLCFPRACLSWPVMRNYDDLNSLFRLFPFDFLPPDDEGWKSLGERTAATITAALAHGEPLPDMTRLADMFGLTMATFRRRLAMEGTSLGAIRKKCRKERALHLLPDGQLSMKEIAADLQFSDVSAFRRAFRQWQGQSPQAFRRGLADIKSDHDVWPHDV